MILYISGHVPSPNIPIAGQKVSWYNLKKISKKNEIFLFFFSNVRERKFLDLKIYENIGINKVEFFHLKRSKRFVNYFKKFYYPFKFSGRYCDEVMKKFDSIIIANKINKIYFEFSSMLIYAKELKKKYPKIKIHFIEHDITFQSYYRLSSSFNVFKNIFYKFEYLRTKKFEIEYLNLMDQIYVLSEKDKIILSDFYIKNVNVLYPDFGKQFLDISRNSYEPRSILFLGAMHRQENQDAVTWFVENVFKKILTDFPDSKFYIVGSGFEKKIKKIKTNNVIYLGYVENLKDVFEKMHIAVVPLRFGAGIKIKTIETVSAKIKTYASNVGAEGVKNDKFLKIVNGKDEFLKEISDEFINFK